MKTNEKIPVEKLEGYTCFACGTANPIGLHLDFYRMGDRICSDVTLGQYYEGWANMAHGGIISTLLDEVMSWTLIYFRRRFFVTRKMELKYVRPVPIGQPLTVKGKLLDGDSRLIHVRGELFDSDKKLLARSLGEFAFLPEERLSEVPQGLKTEMKALFEKMQSVEKNGSIKSIK